MKFACGITLYNPTKSQLDHIKEYAESFSKVFLYDNSEPEYVHDLSDLPSNYIVLTENRNCGLPYAFNKIIADFQCQDVDFLCTLDQDSIFERKDILSIEYFLENCSYLDSIGVIAPYVDYGFGKHEKNQLVESKGWVITSGSFVNLNVVRKENILYDPNYFIDKFEIDMCQQMLTKGYEVLMYHESVLHQELGENSGHHHPNHSPLRHYYLFRNRFYFNRKWHKGLKGLALNTLQTAKHLGLIVLFEDDKRNKVKSLKQAFNDFKRGEMGKHEGKIIV